MVAMADFFIHFNADAREYCESKARLFEVDSCSKKTNFHRKGKGHRAAAAYLMRPL